MSIIGTVYDDVTTEVVGDIGCWQWLMTLVSLILMMPCLFNQHDDMFLLQPPDVSCMPPAGYEVLNYSLCTYTIRNSTEDFRCHKWHVKLMWMIWLKKSWLVFCEDRIELLSTTMICRLGLVFGCVIFGLVSDSFGRKIAIVIDVFAALVLRLVLIFCDSEAWFRLLIFLRSLFGSANYYMGLIIICEIASNRWRSWLSLIVIAPRLMAVVYAVPLANSAPNFETYNFLASFFGVLYIIILRWTTESPQWLLYNRQIFVAEKILYKAGNRNQVKFSGEFKIRPVNYRAYNCLDDATKCIGVITTHNIRILTFVTLLFWSLYYFLWNSLYLKVYNHGNANSVLLKLFAFFAALACLYIFLAKKLKLRHLLFINILLTGAFTFGMTFFEQEPIRSIMSSLALASGIIVHALILNITPRLFAINVRATLVGCCHATGQLGAIISYLISVLQVMSDVTFMSVGIGVTATLAALCFILPDVDGRELPDVMEDMDYFSELSKPLRWATQMSSSASHEEVELRVYSFGSGANGYSWYAQHSHERIRARPIGLTRFWRMLVCCVRRKRQNPPTVPVNYE